MKQNGKQGEDKNDDYENIAPDNLYFLQKKFGWFYCFQCFEITQINIQQYAAVKLPPRQRKDG